MTVISVIMPNDAGIRNVNWESYRTTVDTVEDLTGYDLLALLRDDLEIAVESGTRPPVAVVDGPWAGSAGDPVAHSAPGSTDPDGDALTYACSFGDGGTAAGASVSPTYAGAGRYTVQLVVTDSGGSRTPRSRAWTSRCCRQLWGSRAPARSLTRWSATGA